MNEYSDCYFCDGEVTEQRIARELWWRGRLHLIEDVPVGVCCQCGQMVVLPQVAKTIDGMLASDRAPEHFVQVPAYAFRQPELAA